MPINVLPMPKAQPRSDSSAYYAKKTDDFERFSQQDSPNVSRLSRLDDKREQSQSEPVTTDTQSSDNVTTESKPTDSKKRIRHFKNVLKEQIQSDRSADEDAGQGQEVQTQAQVSDTADKAQTALLKSAVMVSTGQEQSEGKTGPNQSGQNVTNTLISKDNSSSTQAQQVKANGLVIAAGNQQQVVTKQEQLVLETATNLKNTKVSTDSQTTGEGQSLTQQKQAEPANHQVTANPAPITTQSHSNAVKIDATQNSDDSQKQPGPENPNNSATEVKSTNTANQQLSLQSESVLPKEQFAALTAQANASAANAVQTIESKITKAQRQGGQKQNTNASNDNSSADRAAEPQNNEGNRFGADIVTSSLAQRLGVEKVELVNGKNGSPDSNPVNLATLISRGNPASDGATQVTVSNRTAVADAAKTATGGELTQDTSASIREQITQSVQAATQQANKQINIQLNPPELGRVSIKFSEKGTELTGLVETTNPQTRAEIRNAIPEIMRSLEQSGVNVKRIDVTLSDLSDKSGMSRQSNQDSYRDNYSQQLWDRSGNSFQEQGRNHSYYDSFTMSSYQSNSSDSGTQSSSTIQSKQSSADLFDGPNSDVPEALDVLI